MDDIEAARILTSQRVDRSFDPRPAGEVLRSMVEKGYLPGSLLNSEVSVEPLNTDNNQEIAV